MSLEQVIPEIDMTDALPLGVEGKDYA